MFFARVDIIFLLLCFGVSLFSIVILNGYLGKAEHVIFCDRLDASMQKAARIDSSTRKLINCEVWTR